MISVRTKFYARASETRENFDVPISDVAPYSFTDSIYLGQDGLPVSFVRTTPEASWCGQSDNRSLGCSGSRGLAATQTDGTLTSATLTSTISISPKEESSEEELDPERIPVGM